MEALNCETIREEEVRIMICRIPDEHDTFFDSHQLPEFYAEELHKISSDKRRREFITARVAMNQLLSKEVRIVYDKAGKPLLSNHEGHISISHSRKFLALIYHPCKAVGIIEYSGFAKTIDSRFTCECLSCYPDITDNTCHCAWKFTLKD